VTASAAFIGDTTWDTTIFAHAMPQPDEKVVVDVCVDSVGGVAANAAIACSIAGVEARLHSTVADDLPGEAIGKELARRGLDAHLETTRGASTRAVIVLDAAGEKRLFLYPGDRMYPSVEHANHLSLDGVAWMHTALYDLDSAAAVIRRCRDASIRWSIDLEPATIPANLDALHRHIDGCEAVIVNRRARQAIGGDAVGRLFELGAASVIETLGAEGVRLHRSAGEPVAVRPAPLAFPVVDTTGAGDAFAGWFVAERVLGTSIELALQRAVIAAADSVQQVGASVSYRARADIFAGLDSRQIERQHQ
jgi:ribokinase